MANIPPVRIDRIWKGLVPAQGFAVVTDFECYPRIFPEITAVRFLDDTPEKKRVEFTLSLLVPLRYVLDLVCDVAANRVTWTFVEGHIITDNAGGWQFTAQGEGTHVEYWVSVSAKSPFPDFVMRRVLDGLTTLSLPRMLDSIEREARSRPVE